MAKNTAQEIIVPTTPNILRAVFLYTGQGDSTILAIPESTTDSTYKFVLIDSDLDKEENEVNLVELLNDLLGDDKLPIFINTHPHNDHIGGIQKIYDEVGIDEVWHSNHRPKGKHKDGFKELEYVLKKIGKEKEFHLKGTNDKNKIHKSDKDETEVIKKIGLVDFQVFAPAEYVCDDIDEESDDAHYNRIHEHCAVMKFIHKEKSIIFTGDADKKAWKEHITDYHGDNLASDVMTASHHGSRTAFKTKEEDKDPYKEHLEKINGTYLVISAPKQKDSPHGHPNDDAIEIYKEFYEEKNIYHLGEEPYCVVVDIDANGAISVSTDKKLIETYGKGNENKKETEQNRREQFYIGILSNSNYVKPYYK
jgi:beta-lactamase superfamily II metal-dependent hydrolase